MAEESENADDQVADEMMKMMEEEVGEEGGETAVDDAGGESSQSDEAAGETDAKFHEFFEVTAHLDGEGGPGL